MHFHKSGSNPAAVAAILDSNVTASMWGCQGTNSKIQTIVVTPLDGSSVSYPWNTGTPAKWCGNISTNAPVPATSNIIKLLTTHRGRSYRGRVFLPWVDEDGQGNGKVDTTIHGTLQTAWVNFHTALTSAGLDWCVASYKLAVQNPVAAILAESYLGTIRKRQLRNSNT
jgi:hypothetical protein